jgi:hypothetical protein
METLVYMPLLGEGTGCWRPVRAVPSPDSVFEIIEQLPEGESWSFGPGSRVRCRHHVFASGESGLVIYEYAVESNPYYQLLRQHEGDVFRIAISDGEEAVVRLLHVNAEYEDFVYGVLSTNREPGLRAATSSAYVTRFANLVSATLEESAPSASL